MGLRYGTRRFMQLTLFISQAIYGPPFLLKDVVYSRLISIWSISIAVVFKDFL